MRRRGRALGFGVLAGVCALASASIASSYRDRVDQQLGATRPVVTVTRSLVAGTALRPPLLRKATELRQVPVRFLPPDALPAPERASGRKLAVAVPAGSYLLASHLRMPGSRDRGPRLGDRLHPVEVTVSAAGALAGSGAGTKVEVVVAGEPVTGGRARVRVAARDVRLLAVAPADPADETAAGTGGWSATLALRRGQALELIEAENFAREIRLIPSS